MNAIPKQMIFLDPVSGETVCWPLIHTGMPNLTRGPYMDQEGQSYYIQMTQVWPPKNVAPRLHVMQEEVG